MEEGVLAFQSVMCEDRIFSGLCCMHPALSTIGMESDDAPDHPVVSGAVMSLWPVASLLHRDESG